MLRRLVVANLLTSGAHFAHNALFLDSYPGPPWITSPWIVLSAWLVVASALVLGYRWHRQGRLGLAFAGILAFCASCLLVFGHYLYGGPGDYDVLTNVLIVSEGMAGVTLLLYLVGIGMRG